MQRRARVGVEVVGTCALAFGLCGCPTIPATAVTLTDELYQYQKDQVEHLQAISEGYGRILDEESRRQLAPLVDIEHQLELELFRIDGMLAVESDPSKAVPAKWAQDPEVEAFRRDLAAMRARMKPWAPWVKRVETYQVILEGMRDTTTGKVPFTHAVLDDATRAQRILVDGLLQADIGGEAFPAPVLQTALRTSWTMYTAAVTAGDPAARLDARARTVGDSVDALIDGILSASAAKAVGPALAGVRNDLLMARSSRQDLLSQLRATLQERRAQVNALRAASLRNMEAVVSNAEEIARGLDALSSGLRRGHEAVYRPKNDVVKGIQSLAGNLGALGILDEEDVRRFTEKSDALSASFDRRLEELRTLGA